jgi:glutathione S-transferase
MAITFVDLDTARAARGVRMVVLAGVPSPWGEAAKAFFHLKGIDVTAVRLKPGGEAVKAWTGVHNAPVVMFDDDPPRSHWGDILALAERLDDRVRLVPDDVEARARVWGMSHEILGEGGLLWCGRLLMIHASLTSDGARGFPVPVSQYLAAKYGYDPERVPQARARCEQILSALAAMLEAQRAKQSEYLVGDSLTALDVYAATALMPFVPFGDAECPLIPLVRKAFESASPDVAALVAPELLEHRRMIYDRHLQLPIAL